MVDIVNEISKFRGYAGKMGLSVRSAGLLQQFSTVFDSFQLSKAYGTKMRQIRKPIWF